MHTTANFTVSEIQAAFVQRKALLLIERLQGLNSQLGFDPVYEIMKKAEQPCAVRINLRMINQLLQLNEIECAWLETAYIWTKSGCALPDVPLKDEGMRWQALGGLLNQQVKPKANAEWISASQRLRGLALIAPRRHSLDSVNFLGDDLICCFEVVEILERRYASHAHLLNELMKPRFDIEDQDLWVFRMMNSMPEFPLPPIIEDGYKRYRTDRPLSQTHLLAFLRWWCDWVAGTNDYKWLDAHVELYELRGAIQSAVRTVCLEKRHLTDFDLLKAIYAIAV